GNTSCDTSGFAEGGDAVDPADEQHALFVDRRIAQAVGRGLAGVLRPDLVELLRHALSTRLRFALLGFHRALDLDPVVRIVRIHDQQRQLRALPDPFALRAVGSGVDQDLFGLVVEPHRREADATVRPDQSESDRDGPVAQRIVDRIELRQAPDRRALSDGELSRLQSVGDVLELRDGDGVHVGLLVAHYYSYILSVNRVSLPVRTLDHPHPPSLTPMRG